MKIVRYLLIVYALFLIIAGPILRIAGNLLGKDLITNREYFMMVVFFVTAYLLYDVNHRKGTV